MDEEEALIEKPVRKTRRVVAIAGIIGIIWLVAWSVT